MSNHNHVYQEVTTLMFCVLALTFAVATGDISSDAPQDCSLSGCLALMSCYLPSDKDIHVYLLFCCHLEKPTDNLGNAFEAGKQNLKSLFFQKLFTV